MSNKHTHHSNQPVFHQQADTFIVQQLPTSGIVHIARRTTTSHTAGKTCSSPLDAEGSFDTSRRFVRLPANPTERRTESAYSQSLWSKSGREHTSRVVGEGHSPVYSAKTSAVITGT